VQKSHVTTAGEAQAFKLQVRKALVSLKKKFDQGKL